MGRKKTVERKSSRSPKRDEQNFDPITTFEPSSPGATSIGWTVVAVAMIVLLTIAVRIPLLDIPLERDEGEYAYIGWRLDHHELPYRDWINQKPPAVFWVYNAAQSLPVNPVAAIHLMALIFSSLSACALFLLARRFMSLFWALLAAAAFVFLSADPLIQGTAANTEIFMLLPLILSVLAFLKAAANDRHRILYATLSGASTGIAVAFKQVAVVNWVLPIVLLPVFVGPENRVRRTLSFAGWSSIGFAGIWASIAGYFAWNHALGDMVYNVFTHNLEYMNSLSSSARLSMLKGTTAVLARTEALVWILSAVGFVALWRSQRSKSLLFLIGWLFASVVGVSASGYYFPHYFQQFLPVLALASAFAAAYLSGARFWAGLPGWSRKGVLGMSVVILPAITLYPFLFKYTPTESVRKIYPGNPFAEMPELAKRVSELTSDTDKVFIFGSEPEVLFYAQRVSATRYIFLFPLYGPYQDAREKQVATAKEVALSRPAAAVYIPNRLFSMPETEQYFTQWAKSYLQQDFSVSAYLTVDQLNHVHFVPPVDVQREAVPADRRTFGALLIRNRTK